MPSWLVVESLPKLPGPNSSTAGLTERDSVASNAMAKIAVTWKKSAIGHPADQKRTIAGLGLRKLNQTVNHDDTSSVMGMINKVRHLVEVTSIPTSETPRARQRARAPRAGGKE